jgi:colanic acid biosynthesis glycosyl transferase WcaI
MFNSSIRSRRILLVGINYAPEQVGIGPYTTEVASWLSGAGHTVEMITAKPYYPAWRTFPGFRTRGHATSQERGVRVTRCPIYVPAKPSGLRRILHHLSFAASVIPPLLEALTWRRPHLVFVVAPSMICAPVARLLGKAFGAKTWLHVHDFEVGAAMATGLIAAHGPRARLARGFESFAYAGFSQASSVSSPMCERLRTFGYDEVFELRNGASVDEISPMEPAASSYWPDWNPQGRQVVLYSGNISHKQGLDQVIEAARRLQSRADIHFVVCGEGPQKPALMERAAGLANVSFRDLQPRERLNDLLGLATLNVVPQIAGAADLVLPSKLTNILASGKPAIVTADAGTGLAHEVDGCGLVTPPGDAGALATAIVTLVDDPAACRRFGEAARARAFERWSNPAILERLTVKIGQLLQGPESGGDGAVVRPREPPVLGPSAIEPSA